MTSLPPNKSPLWLVVLLTVIVFGGMGSLIYVLQDTPTSAVAVVSPATPANIVLDFSQMPAYPEFPTEMVMLEPTKPPTPKRATTTPIPVVHCGINAKVGELCVWPEPPPPPPTPDPICVTPEVGVFCRWNGEPRADPSSLQRSWHPLAFAPEQHAGGE
jgi:hypothetical protein